MNAPTGGASRERRSESRGLPDRFAPPEKAYSLYEGIHYEDYWSDPRQRLQDTLEHRIISEMLPAAGHRIIDLGCGYGRLTPCYLDRFEQVVLYDGSLSLLRQAYERFGDRAVVIAGDVARLPFRAGSFDNILSIRVLQHLDALAPTFDEMHRVLSRGGRLVFSYHNKRNAHRLLHLIRSMRIGDPFSLESAEVSPTLISHHPERVGALMHDAGFSAPSYRGAVVIDALARTAQRFGASGTAGLRWATFTGRHRLAPWLIGNSVAHGGEPLQSSDNIEGLLVCPVCRSGLLRSDGDYGCPACGRAYPVIDGVLDFRLGEA